MEAMREAWTDGRLDDMNHRVDDLSHRMDSGFTEMRTQISAQSRMMVQLFGGMFATMIVGFLGTIAAVLVQH